MLCLSNKHKDQLGFVLKVLNYASFSLCPLGVLTSDTSMLFSLFFSINKPLNQQMCTISQRLARLHVEHTNTNKTAYAFPKPEVQHRGRTKANITKQGYKCCRSTRNHKPRISLKERAILHGMASGTRKDS